MEGIQDHGTAPDQSSAGKGGPPSQTSQDDGDDEEWEYEYSNHETETYYLTLDLSFPGLKDDPSEKHRFYGRGGYFKKQPSQDAARDAMAQDEGDAEDEHNEDVGETQNLDPNLRSPTTRQGPPNKEVPLAQEKKSKKKPIRGQYRPFGIVDQPASETGTEQIKIDGLHTSEPMIYYRDRIFQGQWAEVVGSEAIFAHHEDQRLLPALRRLPGEIDFLAASSSRIMTKEKVQKKTTAVEDELAPIRRQSKIHIPKGGDPDSDRARQARFLENLAALKLKKGDTDQVPFLVQDRGVTRADYSGGGTEGSSLSSRQARAGTQRPRRGQGIGARSRASLPRRRARSRSFAVVDSDWNVGSANMDASSTPTPRTWDVLEGDHGEGGNDDVEMEE